MNIWIKLICVGFLPWLQCQKPHEYCDITPSNRRNCGAGGRTKCLARGCCFNSAIYGVIWCFYPKNKNGGFYSFSDGYYSTADVLQALSSVSIQSCCSFCELDDRCVALNYRLSDKNCFLLVNKFGATSNQDYLKAERL